MLKDQASLYLNNKKVDSNDFFNVFNTLWSKNKSAIEADVDLPFYGGWFTYLAYELAAHVEPSLESYRDTVFPVAFASRIETAIIRDHSDRCLYLVSNDENAIAQLTQALDRCKKYSDVPEESTIQFDQIEEEPAQQYIDGIAKIKDYIYEGDIFQVNLSRSWKASSNQVFSAASLYHNLRQSNPAPFSALINFENKDIVSSSPERLVKTSGSRVETRPIAGTRPRSEFDGQDQLLADELMENVKERAEHVMLIDLERNDLGRICQPGSIEVDALMVRESYAHVHHIVSNIRGELRHEILPGDVIRAVFPGGTITGCPKVRCMEIIHELENEARGAYTGSAGYINDNGDMDLNILIRTLVCDGNTVQFRAGGGIVADSVADKEVEETRSKAKGLLLALQS